MTRYGELVNDFATPQAEKARVDQVPNQGGGYGFQVDSWKQLDRFLILGQIGSTYYATEQKVVRENADVIKKCVAEDGSRTVARIVEISDAGRAPKNDPAIFALALASGAIDPATRKLALAAVPKVCRIGTHLFHYAADVQSFRRWGRGLRTAVARWYSERPTDDLAMQAIKYQQRDGWSHRDLLRLSHPSAKSPSMDATFRWMVGGKAAVSAIDRKRRGEPVAPLTEFLPRVIQAFDEVHAAEAVKDVVRLIVEHRLPREAIPTQWLNDPKVWEALLPHMGLTAMIRNLGKMTAVGLLKPMSDAAKHVTSQLADDDLIHKGRVHPMQFLVAQGVYGQGRGVKGSLSWTPVQTVRDAVDAGFYLAFKHVVPTNQNTLIALDVSGSMDGGEIAGAPGITPRVASAAMAMVTVRAEPNWSMFGFTEAARQSGGQIRYGGKHGGGTPGFTSIDVSKTERLDAICAKVSRMPMGGTDCALPMIYATQNKLEVDLFYVLTDSETWAGSIHPFQALREYRQKMGRPAKLVVAAMVANPFTIADPQDAGMLDVVGFNSHAPSLISEFAKGNL